MASSVFAMDLRASIKENLFAKLDRLLDAVALEKMIHPRHLVAIKLHFGEKGNTAYIEPVFLRHIVDRVKRLGGKPFLTDANTLYVGSRTNSVDHLSTAIENGFAYAVVGAPLTIADGLRGNSEVAVQVDLPIYHEVYLGADVVHADALISVAHFKGHELAGFGGTIKNIGMGCASRRGKLAQHCEVSPKFNGKKCVGCGECVAHCPVEAITLVKKKAKKDVKKCIGCGECIAVCPEEAVTIPWDKDMARFQKKMVEYTFGVLQGKKDRALFLNFVCRVTPQCDCYSYSDAPLVNDLGILASLDPIAVDQAAVDLVNDQAALPGCCLTSNTAAGEDKFRGVYPHIDWSVQLDYGEKLGLGSRKYKINHI
ncbi:MAG: DUF362 domain-containing protein [Deltaproteobacteria bacterium]|nr:DUF362 domain-containing protein [Deltaproteobacteria bacterium]MBW2070763.1 DUF362 domain-containing protein [Deltaproteobacteria bacterium]